MKKFMIALITMIIILSGCNDRFVEPPNFEKHHHVRFIKWDISPYFIPKTIHVVALGDSLTEGVGDELKKSGYVGRLANRMNEWKGVGKVEVENLAKRGRRSDQLLTQLQEDEKVSTSLLGADIVVLTIGGNDMMKIVKRDLFNLKIEPFYEELVQFESRFVEIMNEIRLSNGHAPILLIGLYNPFSIVTDEVSDFEDIVNDWNGTIEGIAEIDGNACYVPVTDLFNANSNMVYHTDFFHPNSHGYELMTNRIIESLQDCGLYNQTNGEMDF